MVSDVMGQLKAGMPSNEEETKDQNMIQAVHTFIDTNVEKAKNGSLSWVSKQSSARSSPPNQSVPLVLAVPESKVLGVAHDLQAFLSTVVESPKFQVVSMGAGVGALTLGAVGGAVGATAGAATGAIVGVVPALFTFGLSIPAGALVLGTAGAGAGSPLCGTGGLIVGGVSGNVAYAYRVEIEEGIATVRAKLVDISSDTKRLAIDTKSAGQARARQAQLAVTNCVNSVRMVSSAKASDLHRATSTQNFRMTAAGAAGGAVALGAGGSAAGLAAGTVLGAVAGFVPALFTFGLSIPVGALIGGGGGLCLGAAAGTTVGLAAGGAGGYGYSKRQERLNQVVAWDGTILTPSE